MFDIFLSYSFRKCRHTHLQNYMFQIGCYFNSKPLFLLVLFIFRFKDLTVFRLFEKCYFGRSKIIIFEQNSTYFFKHCHIGKFQFFLTILGHGIGNTLLDIKSSLIIFKFLTTLKTGITVAVHSVALVTFLKFIVYIH